MSPPEQAPAFRRGEHVTTALLLTGDAETQLRLLPDQSVNAVCTSPPYFGLRRYGGGEAEIGVEQTPAEFTSRLVAVFEQVRRVLRDDGSCWVVIGDSYTSGGRARRDTDDRLPARGADSRADTPPGLKPKDLIGVPWRLAFALQDAGWYLRHMLVWHKPSVMPESVRDRCTTSHEYILHLTKSERYYHDWFAIAEPSSSSSFERIAQASFASQVGGDKDYRNGTNANRSARKTLENFAANASSVRNARSVWSVPVEDQEDVPDTTWRIPTEPSRIKHFAGYPTRLASRVIEAATPEAGCCAECGAPLRRLIENGEPDEAWRAACGADSSGGYAGQSTKDYGAAKAQDASATKARILAGMKTKITVGWEPGCGCNSSRAPLPAIVLDPFSGAGTTGLCAGRLGRDYIGIDLNPEYNDMAALRLIDSKVKCLDGKGDRLPFAAVDVQRA